MVSFGSPQPNALGPPDLTAGVRLMVSGCLEICHMSYLEAQGTYN